MVDPGHLGPQAGPAVVQSALLDDAAEQAHQRRRLDRFPQLLEVAAPRAQRGGRRGEKVAPVEGGPAVGGRRVAGQLDHAGDRRLAGRLGRRHQQPVVGPDEVQGVRRPGRAPPCTMPRRAVPTPGSTTPSTTPLPRCGTARTRVWLPARTSKGGMWCVRSMTVVPGARAAITAWTTPANSSWVPKSERKKTVGTGSLATGSAAQRCRLRDRSVAAATASMKAERTARASRVRIPAAVVPAGEVTWPAAPRARGPSPASRAAEPTHRLDDERAADLARQAHLHPRLHERLGHQEEVGRPRAREPGHRIEQALGQADDRPHRRQHVLGPGQVLRRGERAARDRRHPGPDQRGRVGHRPDHDRLAAEGRLEALGRARRPRWRAAGSPRSTPEGAAGPLRRVGLHRQDGARRCARRRRLEQPGSGAATVRRPGYTAASSSRRSATGSTTATSPTPAQPERSSPPRRAPPIFPPPTMSRLDTRDDDTEPDAAAADESTGRPQAASAPRPAAVGRGMGQRHGGREVLVGVDAPTSRRCGRARRRRPAGPAPGPPGTRRPRGPRRTHMPKRWALRRSR